MNVYAICCAVLVGCVFLGASACAEDDRLPRGAAVLGEDALGSFGMLAGDRAETEVVTVRGQPFTRAIRARVKTRPQQSYGIQLSAPAAVAVGKGDVLHARFYVRALDVRDETAEAVAEFVFEKQGNPWTKSITRVARAGAEWKRFDVPFRSAESYPAGGAGVRIRLGFRVQTLEIGGLEVLHYGKGMDIRRLPVTLPTYRGQEPDAGWRREARERIEKHRKADLVVRVVDARGRRVRNAEVKVRMKRHAYGFGTAVSSLYLQDGRESEDKRRYREEIVKLFNRTVIENNLKWWGWESAREKAVRTVDWLRSSGIEVRGHCLVWPSWGHLPKDMQARKTDKAYLRKRCLDHIADEAGAMKGKLVDWDVMNEPFTNHDLMDVLGREVMAEWFSKAKEADPGANVYINDYAILSGGGGDTAHRRHYEETIRFLIEQGAPLDGIGVQGHFGSNVTPPEEIWKTLDRFSKFGLPIQVTEYDMKTGIEEFEGLYTRDFMTAVFAHPATVGILMWGFWDGRHWKQNAPIFRRDWSVKPSGEAWIDLVFRKWWTEEDGRTDRRGEFRARGFLGDYEITAERRGRTGSAEFTLTKGGGAAEVVVE